MSLDILAKHVASQGRGRDTALVHMSPREIQSLRVLAKKHGGDLSVNPNTGLPEAGFLEDILPAVAGGAMSYFTGMDPSSSAMIVGGLAGATKSGDGFDWNEGLRAGLGAYGGASVGNSLMGLGGSAADAAAQKAVSSIPEDQLSQMSGDEIAAVAKKAQADALGGEVSGTSKLGEGFKAATGNATDFLKNNGMGLLALSAPFLLNSGSQKSGAPATDPGNIRPYDYDPRTQRYTELSPYKAHYDTGGAVSSELLNSAVNAKTGGEDSKAVYDYLMGRGPNPYLIKGVSGAGTGTGAGTSTDANATTTAPAKPSPSSQNLDLATKTAVERGGSQSEWGKPDGTGGLGYTPTTDLSKPGYISGWAQLQDALDKYGTAAGGWLPLGFAAKWGADALLNKATEAEGIASRDALKALIDKDPTFGGGGYKGPGGETSPTGAGIAARPLGADPATAQGQRFDGSDGRTPTTPVSDGGGSTRAFQGGFGSGVPAANPMGRDPAQQAQDRADQDHAEHDTSDHDGGPGAAAGGLMALAAGGNIGHLGSYSDGGRLLKGPGDGVSDDIPATIGHNQEPARLADGEFVVPARIVSELGNGSTEAGARKLYAMMDRIQHNRRKTVGKNNVAVNSKAERFLPA